MRTITIPVDLDTAVQLLAPEPVLIELTATGPGVGITIAAARIIHAARLVEEAVEEAVRDADPPPRPSPTPTPVAKKAAPVKVKPVKRASNAGATCSTCGRVFGTAHALTIHRARSHKPSPVAAVPPLPPTPINTARSSATPPATQPAPTKPSSMCDRGDHSLCATAKARCSCTCHGKRGQQPPTSRAS